MCRGDYRQAIENSSRAIDLEPRHAAAFNNRGYAYRKLGMYDKAVQGTCCQHGRKRSSKGRANER